MSTLDSKEKLMTTSETALLERTTAGFNVRVSYLPIIGECVLTCTVGDLQVAHTVPLDKALDAFHHPVLHLGEAQVAYLGIK